ncbi:hypothetical protein BY996DRAFT_6426744 [Phakopsora pachyrhizi]|nr:hypothetical protein BY996DRAFT_6429087 [Phakopsora pachyrhizi]KAI8443883.1 hypothetical protein BY996DRAFT_6426744 [Phakopsora pachyrhizi]
MVVSGRIFDLVRVTGSEEGLEGKIGAKHELKSLMRGAGTTHVEAIMGLMRMHPWTVQVPDLTLYYKYKPLIAVVIQRYEPSQYNNLVTGALASALGIQDMTLPPMQEKTGQTSNHLE